MLYLLLRTFFLYFLILFFMRLMGKRQLGQMQISEFVTTVILSELAVLPIADRSVPLLSSLLPLLAIIAFEILFSMLSVKNPKAQVFFESSPTILVDKGVLRQKALFDSRISLKELLVELRIAGIPSLSDAWYVFLEPNGKISVVPKNTARYATVSELSLPIGEQTVDVILISDGLLVESGLSRLQKNYAWVVSRIAPYSLEQIFLFAVDENGKETLIPKEGTE